MIPRTLLPRARQLATRFPVVTITGPRQAGKTTLARLAFPDKRYVSLEDPGSREEARRDPRGFLSALQGGAILDEVQRAPDLPSYLQILVDEDPRPGQWILTGSQHFGLMKGLSQSLAGRTGILHLLPLDLGELRLFDNAPKDLFATLFMGSYPRLYDMALEPRDWFTAYVETYVERDVRQVLDIGRLDTFRTFLGLAAGRAARLVEYSALGADCGVSYHTARSWLWVLDTSFLTYRLRPFLASPRKRLVKRAKLLFYDSGLVCYLLGIRDAEQLRTHPLRGAIFENWVLGEIAKWRHHRGLPVDLHFYRDHSGLEVDVVLQEGNTLLGVEIKSGQTFDPSFVEPLGKLWSLLEERAELPARRESVLVYGGAEERRALGARILPWDRVADYEWVGK